MSAFIAELLQRPHANEVLAEFRFAPETLNEIDVEHAAFIALAHEAIEHFGQGRSACAEFLVTKRITVENQLGNALGAFLNQDGDSSRLALNASADEKRFSTSRSNDSWPCRRDSDALSNGVPTSFPQAPATSCSHEDLRLN
jgi:hypothetical protein